MEDTMMRLGIWWVLTYLAACNVDVQLKDSPQFHMSSYVCFYGCLVHAVLASILFVLKLAIEVF